MCKCTNLRVIRDQTPILFSLEGNALQIFDIDCGFEIQSCVGAKWYKKLWTIKSTCKMLSELESYNINEKMQFCFAKSDCRVLNILFPNFLVLFELGSRHS